MARDFPGDGSSASVVFTASSAQDNFTQFTVSVWYQRTSGGGEFGYGRVIEKGGGWWQLDNNNGNVGWGMLFEANMWSGDQGYFSTAYPSNGVWINDVITYDAGSTSNVPTWYRNGSSITVTTRSTPSGSVGSDTGDFYVGIASDGTEWDGPVCEAAYWNRILTAPEAAALGKGFSPLFMKSGLKFYAPLIGRYSPEIDVVGGTSGTVTGTTNFVHPRIIYPTGGL